MISPKGFGIPGTTGESATEGTIGNVIKGRALPYFARPILPRSVMVTQASKF